MNFVIKIILATSLSSLVYCDDHDFGRSSDSLFGRRSTLLSGSTPSTNGEASFVFNSNSNPSNPLNKWGVTYLSREEARKLIADNKERRKLSTSAYEGRQLTTTEYSNGQLPLSELKLRQQSLPSKYNEQQAPSSSSKEAQFSTSRYKLQQRSTLPHSERPQIFTSPYKELQPSTSAYKERQSSTSAYKFRQPTTLDYKEPQQSSTPAYEGQQPFTSRYKERRPSTLTYKERKQTANLAHEEQSSTSAYNERQTTTSDYQIQQSPSLAYKEQQRVLHSVHKEQQQIPQASQTQQALHQNQSKTRTTTYKSARIDQSNRDKFHGQNGESRWKKEERKDFPMRETSPVALPLMRQDNQEKSFSFSQRSHQEVQVGPSDEIDTTTTSSIKTTEEGLGTSASSFSSFSSSFSPPSSSASLTQEKQEPSHSDLSPTKGTKTHPSPTEKMVVISSTTEDRMALLKDRHREGPQLIFLADDPEAASKIPDLLTTLYDVGPTTKRIQPGFYSNNPMIITERNQNHLDHYTPTPNTIELTPAATLDDKQLERGDRNLNGEILGRQAFFPKRYRPSYDSQPPFNSQGGDYNAPAPFKPQGGDYNAPAPRPGGDYNAPAPRPQHPTYQKSKKNTLTRVTNIEAECQDDFMRIHVRFNGSFDGLLYSSGYSHDLDCVYINGSSRNAYEFYIKLNRCGTLGSNQLEDNRKPIQKNVMWNTLTVQYDAMIEEEWDEHFKVTCEYGLEIWKTVTFPFLDVEVQTGNPMLFTLSPPECHMEIRQGFSPDGPRVTSPVRVGDPLTLVVYMRSQYDGFDIGISDCYAHNGGSKTILLINSYGCPVNDKLISHFEGQSLRDGVFETQIFAFMKTFRFTGSPALYIECGVRMCHGECPAQECHWRRSRAALKKSRRSIPEDQVTTASPSANVSESLNLFQALQVIRDDDEDGFRSSHGSGSEGDFCFKSNHFSIGAGVAAGFLSLLASTCIVLCLRIRRMRKRSNFPPPPQTPIQTTYKSDYVPQRQRRFE